jgi:hypothetical protein
MRTRLPHIFLLILSCAALQLPLTSLMAQDAGIFYMQPPKLGLDVYYKLEEEERRTASLETKSTNQDIRESATLQTEGWIYHPNLMLYDLSFRPEWRQETYHQTQSPVASTQDSRRDTSVLDYDVSTTFLRKKPCSLDLFANRNTRRIDLTDARNTDLTSDTWGARLNFNNPTLPASFTYTNRRFGQTGFYRSDEDRDELQGIIRHNSRRSITELRVLHDETDRTTRSSLDTYQSDLKTTNSELTNTFFFTDDDRIRLDSQLYNIKAKYDGLDHDAWVVDENLYWNHTKNLLGRYRCDYSRRKFNDAVNSETLISAGLTHTLHDRLITDLGATATLDRFEGGNQDLYQSNLGFLYRRPVPWGSVELGAAYTYAVTNRSGQQSVIPTEDRLVLSTGTDTFLTRENVVTSSIVVTNIAGDVVYTENIDYRIEALGPNVRISRILLGAITDGQQVAVRYSYQIDTGYDDSRFDQNYRVGLGFGSNLFLTYTHGSINQNILSGQSPNEALDDTTDTVRLRYNTRWSETQILYDRRDRSNDNSSTTRSVNQLVYLRVARTFSFNFSGEIGDRDYTDLNEKERFYTLGATAAWTPRWWCHLSLVCLRNRISGDRQDMLYSEVTPTVKLFYGVWNATISYRLRDQKDYLSDDSLWRQELFFIISRRLW